jgi:hypothetical protein
MTMDGMFYERITPRYQSHKIIFVQLRFWNPFSKKKGRLLDFSKGGFRIELDEAAVLKEINLDNITLIIPLHEFDEKSQKQFRLKAEIKWIDALSKQIGGTYLIPSGEDEKTIENIIVALAQSIKSEQK